MSAVPRVVDKEPEDSESDVVVVGAGPAGLMLATNLIRFGIRTLIIDDRVDKTATGRADGLQPKSIETLRQMRLAAPLLERGVRIYDICFWSSTRDTALRRTSRETHYPPTVDLLDPYILLVHQGMVEDVFLDDLAERGVEVIRNTLFLRYQDRGPEALLETIGRDTIDGREKRFRSQYVVGCDGAHSQVRKCIPGVVAEGVSSEAIWGVLDGVIETDFPDIWSKVVVHSEVAGSMLCIPRERNMTRLYIELRSYAATPLAKAEAEQDFVMERAREILEPYTLHWETVEWFGTYQIGQRIASHFTDRARRVFIAGDASHTHSPKAAQGMNTAMHDALNLAWKLNLSIRGVARPSLLATYEDERRKIAQDLINFDFEHANAFHDGDATALAQNFLINVGFISGFGVNYGANVLNMPGHLAGSARPGRLLVPAKLTRYIDANPVDAQLDIPMLGQFRLYFLCRDISVSRPFLHALCSHLESSLSVLGRVSAFLKQSHETRTNSSHKDDVYQQPMRYTAASTACTFSLITDTPKANFELACLPPLLQLSRWTIYLDDVPKLDTRGRSCMDKWVGELGQREISIMNVRPDGYVGAINKWVNDSNGVDCAKKWLDKYYSGFLVAQ